MPDQTSPDEDFDIIPIDPETPLLCHDLLLEPIIPAHAHRLYEPLQAAALYTFIPHDPPASLQALTARYTRWAARQSPAGDEVWLNYAIYRPEQGEYLGTLQATLQAGGPTYIAYEIFPRFWRRGLAKKACMALLTHLFDSYGLSAVSALVDTRNEASWRLLESLGFHRTATIPNADHFKGSSSDEYAYELTRHHWSRR